MENFKELQVGQWVKVKGSPENGSFAAHEVKVKPVGENSVMEGKIQGVDAGADSIKMMNTDISLGDGVDFKNADRETINIADLQVGEIAKIKGTFNESGFAISKVKLQEPKGVDLEELQGFIDSVDAEATTIRVVGMAVKVVDETEIEGF